MKKINYLVFSFVLNALVFKATSAAGLLFNITQSVASLPTSVSITLCLNGKGPLSCQDYSISKSLLNIVTTIPNFVYTNAGIRVNTAGYSLPNNDSYCTPIANGFCLFTVSNTSAKSIPILVSGPLSISPSTLPTANLNTSYYQTVLASGGLSPYTYALSSGSLPNGLSLNSSTGVISGTAATDGTYQFNIAATDSLSNTGVVAYSVTVSGALPITPTYLPSAVISSSYSQQLTASGGVSPYSFSLTSGSLPTGLSLSSSGLISGTPTTYQVNSFTVTVTDANGHTGSADYTLVISGTLVLTPTSHVLPRAQLDGSYSQTFTASGGTSPYTYSTSGTLPPGLSINASSGVLSGTPTTEGKYVFEVNAVDSATVRGASVYEILVSADYALLSNFGNNTLSICPINSGGGIDLCNSYDPNQTFSAPAGSAINPLSNNTLYVANQGYNSISLCSIFVDGTAPSCSNSSSLLAFDAPTGAATNSSGTMLYISNYSSDLISYCSLDSDGKITNSTTCPSVSSAGNGPSDIAIDSTNNYAYVANQLGGVSSCVINSGGSLNTCQSAGGSGFSGPTSVALNTVNGTLYLYVANNFNNTVSQCTVNVSAGTLSSCSSSNPSGTFNGPEMIRFNGIGTLAYVINFNNSVMSVCGVNSTSGALTTCTAYSNSTFNELNGLSIS